MQMRNVRGTVKVKRMQIVIKCYLKMLLLEHSTHKFQTGIEYTYKYQGDLKTLLNATVNNSVGFSFDSVITITVLSPCDLVLKVNCFLFIF